MSAVLVPEFAATERRSPKVFFCNTLGFDCACERPEEGDCSLRLREAGLVLYQVGQGRSFGAAHLPTASPFGTRSPIGIPPLASPLLWQGLNLKIRVGSLPLGKPGWPRSTIRFSSRSRTKGIGPAP